MANLPQWSAYQNDDFYFNNQSQVLYGALSDNGWTLPQQSTANITTIAAQMNNGTMWYDTDTDELKVKVAGIVKVVQVV